MSDPAGKSRLVFLSTHNRLDETAMAARFWSAPVPWRFSGGPFFRVARMAKTLALQKADYMSLFLKGGQKISPGEESRQELFVGSSAGPLLRLG